MKKRRVYRLFIILNSRFFNSVVIDSHYELNHPEVSDQLILELVKSINGREIKIDGVTNGFKFIAHELFWNNKPYRIIFTYNDEDFLGVVNAFRIRKIK